VRLPPRCLHEQHEAEGGLRDLTWTDFDADSGPDGAPIHPQAVIEVEIREATGRGGSDGGDLR
jgi:hypothetical protein